MSFITVFFGSVALVKDSLSRKEVYGNKDAMGAFTRKYPDVVSQVACLKPWGRWASNVIINIFFKKKNGIELQVNNYTGHELLTYLYVRKYLRTNDQSCIFFGTLPYVLNRFIFLIK